MTASWGGSGSGSSRLGGGGLDPDPLPPNHTQAAVERPLYDVKLPTCNSEEPIRKHGKGIAYDHYVRLRNDVVHRGRLYDNELRKVRGSVLAAVLRESLSADRNDSSMRAAAMRDAWRNVGAGERIQELMKQKQVPFREHLAATRGMFAELAPILVERISAQPFEQGFSLR